MEAGGREKVMPSQLLRKTLNQLQEGIMKRPQFRILAQKVYKLAT
jgi:hypothetical protein